MPARRRVTGHKARSAPCKRWCRLRFGDFGNPKAKRPGLCGRATEDGRRDGRGNTEQFKKGSGNCSSSFSCARWRVGCVSASARPLRPPSSASSSSAAAAVARRRSGSILAKRHRGAASRTARCAGKQASARGARRGGRRRGAEVGRVRARAACGACSRCSATTIGVVAATSAAAMRRDFRLRSHLGLRAGRARRRARRVRRRARGGEPIVMHCSGGRARGGSALSLCRALPRT